VNTVQLGWTVPADEWERFKRTVEERWGTADRAGVAIEEAWREFREKHEVEQYVSRLAEATGHYSGSQRKKTGLSQAPISEKETEKVWPRIQKDVKQEMEQFADSKGKQYNEVLRGVLTWYVGGGLVERVTEKLKETVPDVEKGLVDGGSDGDGRTTKEKKLAWLTRHFIDDDGTRKQFTADDFGEALEEMPFRGGDTEHMHDKFRPKVLERLRMEEHPNVAGKKLFVPEELAAELRGGADADAPAVDRKQFGSLTDDECVRGLQLKLAERADARNGLAARNAGDIASEVFDGTPGVRAVKGVMDRAANLTGFETDTKGGKKRLKVNLMEVTEPEILEHVDASDEYRDGGGPTDESGRSVDGSDSGLSETETVRHLTRCFIDDDRTRKQFTVDDFEEECRNASGDSTGDARDKLLPSVLDRLNMAEHPNVSGLYVAESVAAEYRDGAPGDETDADAGDSDGESEETPAHDGDRDETPEDLAEQKARLAQATAVKSD